MTSPLSVTRLCLIPHLFLQDLPGKSTVKSTPFSLLFTGGAAAWAGFASPSGVAWGYTTGSGPLSMWVQLGYTGLANVVTVSFKPLDSSARWGLQLSQTPSEPVSFCDLPGVPLLGGAV